MNFFYIGLASIAFITLSGCASLNSDFTCPKQPGVLCNSLDQVNTLIDQGKIGNNATNQTHAAASYPKIQTSSLSSATDNGTVMSDAPLKSSDTHMRIWVAPFEDENGNYYTSSHMYAVVRR